MRTHLTQLGEANTGGEPLAVHEFLVHCMKTGARPRVWEGLQELGGSFVSGF